MTHIKYTYEISSYYDESRSLWVIVVWRLSLLFPKISVRSSTKQHFQNVIPALRVTKVQRRIKVIMMRQF